MGFREPSTYSSAVFLEAAIAFFAGHGISIKCVQTDNGFEFTNPFSSGNTEKLTPFQTTAIRLGIHHRTIKPFTPRHNGKVERSHREDQKRFYDTHPFYSFMDYIDHIKSILGDQTKYQCALLTITILFLI